MLDKIRKQLRSEGTESPNVSTSQTAVYGLGGTGKSQLAIEYAWRWAWDYTGVLWLRCETAQALDADLDALVDDLELLQSGQSRERAKVIEAVRKHLSQNPGWLMIIDNAADPFATQEVVPRSGGHVLITSRYAAWGSLADPISVGVWEPEEAIEFLSRRLAVKHGQWTAEEEAAAHELAKEFGYLPLALEHAVAYCEQKGLGLAGYLDRFQEHRLKLFAPHRFDGNHRETIATTWSLSIAVASRKHPGAATLLNLAAFLDADRIPIDIILQHNRAYLPNVLAKTVGDPLAFDDATAELLRYSLVSVEAGNTGRVLSLHRLVQEVVRERLRDGDNALSSSDAERSDQTFSLSLDVDETNHWITTALQVVAQAFPERSHEIGSWPVCRQLAPHAAAILSHAEPLEIDPTMTSLLLHRLGAYALGRAEYASAGVLFERALVIRESALGPEHPDTASTINDLGELNRHQGRYEQAEPLYQRALAIRKKALGPEHPDTAESLNNLALLYAMAQRYEEAEPLYRRALSIWEEALGAQHTLTGLCLNNLAALYTRQKRHDEAEPLYQRALAIREDLLGSQHPDTAQSLNNLAMLYYAKGDYERAEPLFRRSLAIREGTLGTEHPITARGIKNLAQLYLKLGRYDDAEPLCRRALSILEKTVGPDHPDTRAAGESLMELLRSRHQDFRHLTVRDERFDNS